MRAFGRHHLLIFAVASLTFAGPATPVRAAVRVCKGAVASPRVTAATEDAARKAALDAWKAEAEALGPGFSSWRLASGRFLKCLPAKAGGFECIASAAPCMIEQAPSRRHLREKRIGI
jgi:hypothetical protein